MTRDVKQAGNWIEVYQEQVDEIEELELRKQLKKQKRAPKVEPERLLNADEVRQLHGNIDFEFVSNLKANGQQYIRIVSQELKDLQPVTADFSVNNLNLDAIQPHSSRMEALYLPFNNIAQLQTISTSSWQSLVLIDLSWNYLTDESVVILSKLTNIEVMDLSGNRFEEFPVEHDTFRNLTQLSLSSNRMTEHCFRNLVRLEALESLHLNKNKIKLVPLLGNEQKKVALVSLEFLDLSDNPISDETSVLSVASCPRLKQVLIARTKLIKKHKGMPPLLQKYLVERIGIDVRRSNKQEPPEKKTIVRKYLKKCDLEQPKLDRSTIEERLAIYRSESAIEGTGDARVPIEGNTTTINSAPVIVEDDAPLEQLHPSFFLTQEDQLEGDTQVPNVEKWRLPSPKISVEQCKNEESAIMAMTDISFLELSPAEQAEYDTKVVQIPINSAFNQLQTLLNAQPTKTLVCDNHRVRRQPEINLTETLKAKREREVTKVINVEEAIAGSHRLNRKMATELYREVEDKYYRNFKTGIAEAMHKQNSDDKLNLQSIAT